MSVYVVEGDNNESYSDHNNWHICVAANLEAAKAKIRAEYSEIYDTTNEPIQTEEGVFSYTWELHDKDNPIKWSNNLYNGHHITIYMFLENVVGEE